MPPLAPHTVLCGVHDLGSICQESPGTPRFQQMNAEFGAISCSKSAILALAEVTKNSLEKINGKFRRNTILRSDRTLTVWVDATIDQFRLYPDDAPCEFRLSRIELLVPDQVE